MSMKHPIVGTPPYANATRDVAPASGSALSPAFFAVAIVGSLAFLCVVTAIVVVLRRFGYCFCPEPLPDPEDAPRVVVVAAPSGLPVALINSFPVSKYGSKECEALLAEGKAARSKAAAAAAKANATKPLTAIELQAAPAEGGKSAEEALPCPEQRGAPTKVPSQAECAEDSKAAAAKGEAVASSSEAGGADTNGRALLSPMVQGGNGSAPDDAGAGRGGPAGGSPLAAGGGEEQPAPPAQEEMGAGRQVAIGAEGSAAADSKSHLTAAADVSVAIPPLGQDGGGSRTAAEGAGRPPGGPSSERECAVCLGEFEDGEEIKILPPCGHGFHVACITQWLTAKDTCPVCRCCLAPPQAPRRVLVRRPELPFWP